jgi:hypothetical protein
VIDIDALETLARDAAETGIAGHLIKFFMTIDPDTVVALIAEVRELREDKSRLDFIEATRPAAIDPPIGSDINWYVLPSTSDTLEHSGNTVRDAIDAARKDKS